MAGRDDDGRLASAYERMLERIRQGSEAGDGVRLSRLLDAAQRRAIELRELSREEAERIGEALRRDIAATAAGGAADRQALLDWLRLDLGIAEQRLLDLFSSVADRTRLGLLELEMAARAADPRAWEAGQITGLGALQCTACRQTVRIRPPGRIPDCPDCRGTLFVRTGKAPD